jgi:DNA-binding transcriptional LysR family regulator
MDFIENLRHFCATVEAGSFTRAASALNVTPPVMSRKIASLEQRLGTRLFNRTTRHVVVTEAGESLYERVTQILDDLDSLERSMLDKTQEAVGLLRLVAHTSATVSFLTPLLSSFKRAFPKVVLDVTLVERPVDLVAEGYDLGIVVPFMLTTDMVVTQLLERFRQIVVAAPDYLVEHGTPRHPSDLELYAFITASLMSRRVTFCEGAERLAISPASALFSNSPLLRRAMILDGLGLGVLPEPLVADDLASGRLVRVVPEFPLEDAHVEIQLAYRQRTLQPPKVRKFVEHARAYYENISIGNGEPSVPSIDI